MIKVKNVNMEWYAVKARGIAVTRMEKRWSAIAERFGQELETPTPEGEMRILEACESTVRKGLAAYLVNHGIVTREKTVCHGDRYRTREADVDRRDIPKRFLDVASLIPDFSDMVASYKMEARKEILAREIEKTTRASENQTEIDQPCPRLS